MSAGSAGPASAAVPMDASSGGKEKKADPMKNLLHGLERSIETLWKCAIVAEEYQPASKDQFHKLKCARLRPVIAASCCLCHVQQRVLGQPARAGKVVETNRGRLMCCCRL